MDRAAGAHHRAHSRTRHRALPGGPPRGEASPRRRAFLRLPAGLDAVYVFRLVLVDLLHQRVEAELLLVVEHRAQVVAETVANVTVGVARVLPELVRTVTALLEERLDVGVLRRIETELLRETLEE